MRAPPARPSQAAAFPEPRPPRTLLPPLNLAPGTRVNSVVRLLRPLGRGGMGSVWVAEHTSLKTEVVVKFMSDELVSDPVSLARFSREASAAAAVKSPHVVQMLDHGFTSDGTPFIVMELLDGEDLRARLQRDKVVPLAELAVIVSHACKALARAHAVGIVHRDIKPDNIFLCRTDDGEPFVKILDFGVAKAESAGDFHMTQTGVMVGTPFYMSPEQAMGAPPIDATSDLWSLGVVTYEAMLGVRPFDGATLGALTMAICNTRPAVPSTVDFRVPRPVDAWLARVCAREQKDRFPDAKSMADAFMAALHVSTGPRAVRMAFEATTSSDEGVRPPPLPPPDSVISLSSVDFATTTRPLSRTHQSAHAKAAALASVASPVTAGSPTPRRAWALGAAAVALALGALAVVAVVAVVRTGDDSGAPARRAAAPPPPASSSIALPVPLPPPEKAAPSPSVWPSSSAWVPPLPPIASAPPAPPPVAKPQASATAPVRPPRAQSAAAPAPSASSASCNPPYYFDEAHNKVFKTECLTP
jgi:eukaryotic-like serine/threonine-protein kinase